MAIELRIILDTDTPESGRIICNDNFSITKDQINRIITYLDADFGILKNLSNVETVELKVGSNKLSVTNTSTIINDNVSLNGSINVKGNVIEGNIFSTIINNDAVGVVAGIYSVGSASTTPPYYIYQVTSSSTSGLQINLFPGVNGQKVKFLFVNDPSGAETFVKIVAGGTALIYMPTGMVDILINEIGQSIEFVWLEDGWYINGGNGYTFE